MSENIIYTVKFPTLDLTLQANIGDNLLDLMRANNIFVGADCGGIGSCGKCKVRVDGKVQLACRTNITHDLEVYLPGGQPDKDGQFEILSDYRSTPVAPVTPGTDRRSLAIAIDLGTTTVVGKLLDLETGYEWASFARVNAQRAFGADVISRIEVASDDATMLSKLITEQIDEAVSALLVDANVDTSTVKKLIIAGNTVMSYILLGLPCRSLGATPFIPEFAIESPYPYERIFGRQTLSCNCDVLPFISAFVGGDLTSGLCSLSNEDDFILMDLGTNGELLYKRGDRLIGTATAAGPAFEGACIECGSGSTRGAISSVWMEDGRLHHKTIGDAAPTGICGSGILDLMAVLIEDAVVDETGRLASACGSERFVLSTGLPTNGYREVYFSQKDVRQFQLAKSAVRTGLDILIKEMGGELPSKLFLAGGFGQALSPKSAVAVGLLPTELEDRVIPVGNSSLGGAIKLCFDDSVRPAIIFRIATAEEINLANHPDFNDLFMENMYFGSSLQG